MKRPSSLHVVAVKRKPDNRIGLMNPDFRYIPAASTDIRATFNRIRAELAQRSKT